MGAVIGDPWGVPETGSVMTPFSNTPTRSQPRINANANDQPDDESSGLCPVSSARQRDEETIGSQLAALDDYARSQGWTVPAEWVFADDGYSGSTLARPALDRLRDLVAQVPVEVVVVYSPDRLSRFGRTKGQ